MISIPFLVKIESLAKKAEIDVETMWEAFELFIEKEFAARKVETTETETPPTV